MKVHSKSLVQLHDLYHRKEGASYILGNPETSDYMFVSPVELRAVQLINSNITIAQAQELLAAEQETVDLHKLLHELKEHHFIHKIDNRVVTAKHEPLHDVSIQAKFLGGPSMRFLFILLSLFGVWTLLWRTGVPTYTTFFQHEQLSITLLTVLAFAWLLVATRQFFKYAAAQYLGIPVRFGFTNIYHVFIPKVYAPAVHEEQEHYVLGMSLLSLTALTSVAALLAAYLPHPYNTFWYIAFAVGFIEILCEGLLFMDTDFAKYISITTNVHKLNAQTAKVLKEDWHLFWQGKGRQSHPAISRYAFFYVLSILIGIIVITAYVLPALLYFLLLAFKQFTPGNPQFIDAFIALLFFSIDLLLYGFALLRQHSLNHNNLFVNASLGAVVVGSYILAAIGLELFTYSGDALFTIVLTYLLGVMLALLFEYSVRFAYPFTEHHTLFSSVMLPVLAACIPISVLFTVTYTADLYIYALILGIGMLTALAFSHLHRITAPAN